MENPQQEKQNVNALVYGLEQRVPFGAAVMVGAQQVAAMVVGTITPPLILAGVLKWTPEQTAYCVSMALLASALGTLLQTMRPGKVGSGLLSVTGTSFSFLQPLMAAHAAGGMGAMFGLSLVTAPLQIVLAPFLPKLRRVFSPLVSGTVVLLIGLSLIPSAYFSIAAPLPGAPGWAGAVVAGVVLVVLLAAQMIGKAWARLAGVLLGVGVGYAVCGAAGWLTLPAAPAQSGMMWPRWMPWGWAWEPALVLPFAFIYLVSLVEAMGDMTATAQLSGVATEGDGFWARLRGGVLADGLTSTVAALFGGLPSTTYAQNNGVIQMTGVASRRVGPYMAAMLAVLAIFPVFSHWMAAMPPPVLGALAMLLFGLVAVSGLRLIASGGVGQREALIVAVALGIGLGAPTKPEWLALLPGAVRALLESGIAAGGLAAMVLNAVLPRERAQA